MTTPAQLTELSKAATRTAYFAEFQFLSGTSRLSSLNFDVVWGDQQYLSLPGVASNYASTPDSVATSVTGDIDVRVKLAAADWTVVTERYVFTKGDHGTDRSFSFGIQDTSGKLVLYVSSNGTAWLDGSGHASSVAPSFTDGTTYWIRATRVSATGVITYYTSSDGIIWTQLGTTIASTSGALFNATGLLRVNGPGELFAGQVYYAELRSGIAGTLAAIFDAQDAQINATSFVGSVTGETWTVNQSGGSPAVIAGGFTWTGLGSIGAIDAVQESDSVEAKALTFTLNVAQPSILALAVGDVAEYRGRTAKLYFCPLSESFQLVGTPERCWTGIMDTLAIGLDGEQGGISLRCESRAYALKRRPSLRLNAAQQKARHPADTGLDYLTDLIAKPQLWASKKFQQSQI